MIRSILLHPDPRLKKLCVPVADVSSDVGRLAEDMLQTMYDAPGVGLAAPQIGVQKRLFVMDCVKDVGGFGQTNCADQSIYILDVRRDEHL